MKFFGSPDAFSFADEFVHLRNTQAVLDTGHLFAGNPLLPTAAYYPGLAAVTAGLVALTGLSPFAAGVLVVGAARVLFCACFFLVAEKVTGSSRAAAAASLIYAANPMFLFWSPRSPTRIWRCHSRRSFFGGSEDASTRGAVRLTPSRSWRSALCVVTHHVAGFALAALLVHGGLPRATRGGARQLLVRIGKRGAISVSWPSSLVPARSCGSSSSRDRLRPTSSPRIFILPSVRWALSYSATPSDGRSTGAAATPLLSGRASSVRARSACFCWLFPSASLKPGGVATVPRCSLPWLSPSPFR